MGLHNALLASICRYVLHTSNSVCSLRSALIIYHTNTSFFFSTIYLFYSSSTSMCFISYKCNTYLNFSTNKITHQFYSYFVLVLTSTLWLPCIVLFFFFFMRCFHFKCVTCLFPQLFLLTFFLWPSFPVRDMLAT
jgi:hypothetical protein